MAFTSPRPLRRAFTLIEIVIVVAILGLLAALLFPALARAREQARQGSCTSNLHQIGLAVTLYSQDFSNRYPTSLADLVPPALALHNSAGGEGMPDKIDPVEPAPTGDKAGDDSIDDAQNGGGYLRSTGVLLCPDDSLKALWNRSSYGVLFGAGLSGEDATRLQIDLDFEPVVWNYYGYRADGTAFRTPEEAAQGAQVVGASGFLRNPNGAYDAHSNPFKRSLSNRYLPPDTIITHCRFHRAPTSDLRDPNALYTDPQRGRGARDAVLRLDGSARVQDVSGFADSNSWRQ